MRNVILIGLCIAQPTVAIASEVSWAGNIGTESWQNHLDWRGHPDDLSSDLRVQSAYQLSPDSEIAVQASVRWQEKVTLEDLFVGVRAPAGQLRYGKLSSLLSEPVVYSARSEKQLAKIPIFFERLESQAYEGVAYDSPSIGGIRVSVMSAKSAPYNPEFRRLVANNDVDRTKNGFFMKKVDKHRHPQATTVQISYQPNDHLFARYTRASYQDHVPVFQKNPQTVDWSADWQTTISGLSVTGFEPGTINRYEAGIRQNNYAFIVGAQTDHLSGLPFAFDSHQYAPFNQSVNDSQRIGVAYAKKLSSKITARIGYVEGKSHWVNGIALPVTHRRGNAPSRIAPYFPDKEGVMSPETSDKFVCKALNQDGTCKTYYTPEEIDKQIRELVAKLNLQLLEANWRFESDVTFNKSATTISSGVSLEDGARNLGGFANTIRTGSCGVGQNNPLACKEGAEQVIEKAKTLYEHRTQFAKAVLALNETKQEIDHWHEVLTFSKVSPQQEVTQALLDRAATAKNTAQQASDATSDLEPRAANVENYLRAEANSMVCHLYESDGTINLTNERLIEALGLTKSTVCAEAPPGFNQSIDTKAKIVQPDSSMICREFGNTSDPDRSKWTCNQYISLEEAATIVDGDYPNETWKHNYNSYQDQSNSYLLHGMVSYSLDEAKSEAYNLKLGFLEIYTHYLTSKTSAVDVYMGKPQEYATSLWIELHDWANSNVLCPDEGATTCKQSEFQKLKDLHHQANLIFEQVNILIPDITKTNKENRGYYNRIKVVVDDMKNRIDKAQPYIVLLESVLSYGIDLANYVGCDVDPEEPIVAFSTYSMLNIANELGLDFVCRADALIELRNKAKKARDDAEKEVEGTNLIPGFITQATGNAKSRTANALGFCQQDPRSIACQNAAIDAWHDLYIAFIYRNDLAFQHQKVQSANTILTNLVLRAHSEAIQADRGVTYDIEQVSAIEGYKNEVSNDKNTGFYDQINQFLQDANNTLDASILDASSPQLVGCYLPKTFERKNGSIPFDQAKAKELAQAIPHLDFSCESIPDESSQSTAYRASTDDAIAFIKVRPGTHQGGDGANTSPSNPTHPLHKIYKARKAASDAWDASKASDAAADRQERVAYEADQKADKSQNPADRKESDAKIAAALKARLKAKIKEQDAKVKERAYIQAYRIQNGADPAPLEQHLSTPTYTQEDFNPPQVTTDTQDDGLTPTPQDASDSTQPTPDTQSAHVRLPHSYFKPFIHW